MSLPLVQPPIQSDICVIGDVTIHEGAVVAPGTILQASPNSRIVIREGACIGMGTLINAYQGDIEIQSGAMLGAGVLVVGQCQIGKNSCIGSSTTIINTSIDSGAVIDPGSLIGDTSRSVSAPESQAPKPIKSASNGSISDKNGSKSESEKNDPQPTILGKENDDLWLDSETDQDPETEVEKIPEMPTQPTPSTKIPNAPVVGQIYINQLLYTLFPERQAFNRSQNNS
ncbi:MAG TPA: transferase [Cyanothece sp. UBA12306]|nr:transferase [Cyanothece sp. UBA12306]